MPLHIFKMHFLTGTAPCMHSFWMILLYLLAVQLFTDTHTLDPVCQHTEAVACFACTLSVYTPTHTPHAPALMPTALSRLLVVRLMDSQPVMWAGTVASW